MDYDIIIVGARVAGAVLATRLGQVGHRVLLLEKANFPSDSRSTSFFRAPALRIFEKIGVLEEVVSAAPPLRTLWNYINEGLPCTGARLEREILPPHQQVRRRPSPHDPRRPAKTRAGVIKSPLGAK